MNPYATEFMQPRIEPTMLFLVLIGVTSLLFVMFRKGGFGIGVGVLILPFALFFGRLGFHYNERQIPTIYDYHRARREVAQVKFREKSAFRKHVDTIRARSEEAQELNEQVVADVYRSAEYAVTSLALQLAAQLRRDDQLSDSTVFHIDRQSFRAVSERNDVAEKIYHTFLRDFKEPSSESGGDWKVSIAEDQDDSETLIPPDPKPKRLVLTACKEDTKYEVKAAYLDNEILGVRPGGMQEIVEYGVDEEEGESSCIVRAIEQIEPHVEWQLRDMNVNSEYLADQKPAFLRAVTEELKTAEFPQLYTHNMDGTTLEVPQTRVTMTFNVSQDKLREAIAENWRAATQQEFPEGALEHRAHVATHVPQPESSLIVAVCGLLFVYAGVYGASQIYES